MHSVDTADREIFITRTFNAPRELVFKVWTDPEHIAHWWGPTGFTTTVHEMDVRPGGVWRLTMRDSNGVDYPNRSVFEEVVPPARLVFTNGWDREENQEQFRVTVEFEDQGDKTLISMRMVFGSVEACRKVVEQYGAIEGNRQTLDRLEAYLAAM